MGHQLDYAEDAPDGKKEIAFDAFDATITITATIHMAITVTTTIIRSHFGSS